MAWWRAPASSAPPPGDCHRKTGSDDGYAKPMNDIPKVVFSRTLTSADWPLSTIPLGDLFAGLTAALVLDLIEAQAYAGGAGTPGLPPGR
jgi:hypothetical protein